MLSFYEDYLERLQARHQEIREVLNGLPPAALDWIPGPGFNSMSVVIFHLTGAERFWIGDVVAGEASKRDRESEFKVQGVGMEALKKRLEDNEAYARSVLSRLTLQDLERTWTSPKGEKRTHAWALLHALEHLSLHVGHLQITRQLWDQAHTKAGAR